VYVPIDLCAIDYQLTGVIRAAALPPGYPSPLPAHIELRSVTWQSTLYLCTAPVTSCIHTLNTINNWIINNTCYANGLDSQVGAGSDGLGELAIHGSSKTYLTNNLVFAWTRGYAYYQYNSDQVYYYHNSYYYGLGLKVPASVASDSNQIRMANPIFVWRPALDPNADGQYRSAIAPDQISNRFELQQQSSLIDIGIDPRTIPNIPPEIQSDLGLYILNDAGQPHGSGFDLGAFEYHLSVQTQYQHIFLASVRK
jgi:hypothetical protein